MRRPWFYSREGGSPHRQDPWRWWGPRIKRRKWAKRRGHKRERQQARSQISKEEQHE
jgi:hypothetical protein